MYSPKGEQQEIYQEFAFAPAEDRINLASPAVGEY
jgi:hypothetical protein